ncbi:hypothetical protein CHS0354_011348 [Potamilus streckersoni]|uniref:CCHC-type domain-containing protein n=1 Tax=Potamilus streckersoni TaxID=2493646 RepID=A0AAE0TF00_9BIVA|nr:hypothetical protein CHS0354_011348 [Potamilus streckersoni]
MADCRGVAQIEAELKQLLKVSNTNTTVASTATTSVTTHGYKDYGTEGEEQEWKNETSNKVEVNEEKQEVGSADSPAKSSDTSQIPYHSGLEQPNITTQTHLSGANQPDVTLIPISTPKHLDVSLQARQTGPQQSNVMVTLQTCQTSPHQPSVITQIKHDIQQSLEIGTEVSNKKKKKKKSKGKKKENQSLTGEDNQSGPVQSGICPIQPEILRPGDEPQVSQYKVSKPDSKFKDSQHLERGSTVKELQNLLNKDEKLRLAKQKYLDNEVENSTLITLQKDRIYPLKKKSDRFPGARYFCRLCEYHCDSVAICMKHIKDDRHKRKKEITLQSEKLRKLPAPSLRHVQAMDKVVEEVFTTYGLSKADLTRRQNIVQEVQTFLNKTIPDVILRPYGSSLSGLGLKSSDLNIDLVVPEEFNGAKALTLVYKALQESDIYQDVKNDFTASVPHVRFTDPDSAICCQITINSNLAYYTSRLLSIYTHLDSRLTKVASAFRYWAKICSVDKQEEGSLPSYLFGMMTVYFFQQCNPPVLPVLWKDIDLEKGRGGVESSLAKKLLNQLEQTTWASSNSLSVGHLWIDLLKFYAGRFDMGLYVICIKQHKILTRAEKKWNNRRIAVEDPFSPKRNAARTVGNSRVFEYIYDSLRKACIYFALPSNSDDLSPSEILQQKKVVRKFPQDEEEEKKGMNKEIKCLLPDSNGSQKREIIKKTSNTMEVSPEKEQRQPNNGVPIKVEWTEVLNEEARSSVDENSDVKELTSKLEEGENIPGNENVAAGQQTSEDSEEGIREHSFINRDRIEDFSVSNKDSLLCSEYYPGPDNSLVFDDNSMCAESSWDADSSVIKVESFKTEDSSVFVEDFCDASSSFVEDNSPICQCEPVVDGCSLCLSGARDNKNGEVNKLEINSIQVNSIFDQEEIDCGSDFEDRNSNYDSESGGNLADSESDLTVKKRKKYLYVAGDTEMSQSKIQPDDIKGAEYDYAFSVKYLTDGKGPAVICSVCDKEGHFKQSCPEEKLPPVLSLPPMTTYHLDLLNRVIKKVPVDFQLSRDEIDMREMIRADLEQFLLECFPDICLMLFGSTYNGFGFRLSDIDICATFKDKSSKDINAVEIIETISKRLKTHKGLYGVFPITTAKVPIVKFIHRASKLEGDISLYNLLGQFNTKLLSAYCSIDPRVKMLGYAIKVFAKVCDIGDASKGSLSSYAYILMVIHYLQQCKPPVIPVLQELPGGEGHEIIVDGWNTWFFEDIKRLRKVWPHYGKNHQSVGDLWFGMFRYYLEEFSFKDHVVSIRQLKPLTKFEKLWNGKCIAIEDPFDFNHNLGAGLSLKMNKYIVTAFIRGRELYGTPFMGDIQGFASLEDYFFDSKALTVGEPPTDRCCRVCNKIGHIAKDCPRAQARKERSAQEKKRRDERKIEEKKKEENSNERQNQKSGQGNSKWRQNQENNQGVQRSVSIPRGSQEYSLSFDQQQHSYPPGMGHHMRNVNVFPQPQEQFMRYLPAQGPNKDRRSHGRSASGPYQNVSRVFYSQTQGMYCDSPYQSDTLNGQKIHNQNANRFMRNGSSNHNQQQPFNANMSQPLIYPLMHGQPSSQSPTSSQQRQQGRIGNQSMPQSNRSPHQQRQVIVQSSGGKESSKLSLGITVQNESCHSPRGSPQK